VIWWRCANLIVSSRHHLPYYCCIGVVVFVVSFAYVTSFSETNMLQAASPATLSWHGKSPSRYAVSWRPSLGFNAPLLVGIRVFIPFAWEMLAFSLPLSHVSQSLALWPSHHHVVAAQGHTRWFLLAPPVLFGWGFHDSWCPPSCRCVVSRCHQSRGGLALPYPMPRGVRARASLYGDAALPALFRVLLHLGSSKPFPCLRVRPSRSDLVQTLTLIIIIKKI